MLSKINGGGHGRCYILPTSVRDTKNNYLPMEDKYSGLICKHNHGNILNKQNVNPGGIYNEPVLFNVLNL